MQVRLGSAKDVERALETWRAAQAMRRGGKRVSETHERKARGYLGQSDAFFVVIDDGSDVAALALAMDAREKDGRGARISATCQTGMLAVAPARAGQGLGRQVYGELLREAYTRGYRHAQVWTQVDNLPARRVYESFGFVATGREKHDRVRGKIMQYRLEDLNVHAL